MYVIVQYLYLYLYNLYKNITSGAGWLCGVRCGTINTQSREKKREKKGLLNKPRRKRKKKRRRRNYIYIYF